MSQLIIAVDVDDVVANLISAWLRLYNNDYGDLVLQEDITNWNIHEFVSIGHDIYDYLDRPYLYEYVEPIDGALWGVNKLRQMGFRVVFVTSTNVNQNGQKLKWLQKYGFLPKNIKFEQDYIEATDKSLIHCDYLIDDKPENVSHCRGMGLLFDRPHNQRQNLPRVSDWLDVISFFEDLQDEQNNE